MRLGGAVGHLGPGYLVHQHGMAVLRRRRQRRVDARCEGVDPLRVERVVVPQHRAAMLAEMPAGEPLAVIVVTAAIVERRAIDGDMLLALYRQRFGLCHDVDGVAPSAGELAAGRAVAARERIRRIGVDRDRPRAPMAGSFQLQRMPPAENGYAPHRTPYFPTPVTKQER